MIDLRRCRACRDRHLLASRTYRRGHYQLGPRLHALEREATCGTRASVGTFRGAVAGALAVEAHDRAATPHGASTAESKLEQNCMPKPCYRTNVDLSKSPRPLLIGPAPDLSEMRGHRPRKGHRWGIPKRECPNEEDGTAAVAAHDGPAATIATTGACTRAELQATALFMKH
jgi:hypothetical protein